MATESGRATALTRCLQFNALALGFSLAHVIGDYAILTAPAGGDALAVPWYLALAGAVYGWWRWSMARVAAGGRTGLFSLWGVSWVLVGYVVLRHARGGPQGGGRLLARGHARGTRAARGEWGVK